MTRSLREYAEVIVVIMINCVVVAAAWGRIETRIDEQQHRIESLENQNEKFAEKLNSIDKNCAVIAEWVDEQKHKTRN